jgi:hypothetical protein
LGSPTPPKFSHLALELQSLDEMCNTSELVKPTVVNVNHINVQVAPDIAVLSFPHISVTPVFFLRILPLAVINTELRETTLI